MVITTPTTPESVGLTQADYALDDHQVIDDDIDSLKAKFITPIDRYRSHSNPNSQAQQQPGLKSSQTPQESRTHAFYRILGLPSIGTDGSLVSPGFCPSLSAQDKDRAQNLKISEEVKQAQVNRENDFMDNAAVFANGTQSACIFSLCLSVPNGQRAFSVVPASDTTSIQSLDTIPQQVQSLPNRVMYISSTFKYSDGFSIPENDVFNTVSHPLAPFMTDPVINANLDPKSGSQSVMVAAPFLKYSDTEHESNKYLNRCGLEMILILRLREQNSSSETQATLDNIETEALPDISNVSQKEIAAALSNIGVDTVDVTQVLNGAGQIELYTLNDLVRAFKKLIHLYVQAIETISNISNEIMWVPLCKTGGPESGTSVSTLFVIPNQFIDSWNLERRIRQLQVKSSLATKQYEMGNTSDCQPLTLSNFTIPSFNSVRKVMDDSLSEANSQRDQLEADGSNALKTIEIISGEVSGLGLIDIIAVYMALWSLDVPTLLNLIDDPAATRLNSIGELKNGQTQKRASTTPGNAKAAYGALALRVQTILSYADRLYQLGLAMPEEADGGDIPRDTT